MRASTILSLVLTFAILNSPVIFNGYIKFYEQVKNS